LHDDPLWKRGTATTTQRPSPAASASRRG
jgi:hypothetical protein